tara:strand:- start:5147 stop:5350 length:204 start_codon:yes stop_codon:yes gene_type:complete
MPQRTLRFKIRQDGLVEETVEGLVGDSCLELTKKLESALGRVQHRKSTAEAYLNEANQTQVISLEIH